MSDTITLTRQALGRLIEVMYTPDPNDPYDPLGPFGRIESNFSASPWLGQTVVGRPRDDDPGPWGPIGPIIRTIRQIEQRLANPQPLPAQEMRMIQELLNRVHRVLLDPRPVPPQERPSELFGPFPEPWRLAFTARSMSEVLGPFPQPWRLALTARSMIEQAVAQYQWAQVLAGDEGGERGARVIGQQLRDTVRDWCGTPPGPRWPFPWPPPFAELGPLDLLLAGVQFQHAADALGDHPLQGDLGAAADQLLRTALEQLESGNDASARMAKAG